LLGRLHHPGAEAIALVQKTNYDVILLDLKMPEMDGLTVMQEIRKLDENVSVVILTAYGTVSHQLRGHPGEPAGERAVRL
jgi:CheY-like chemotaxis protein